MNAFLRAIISQLILPLPLFWIFIGLTGLSLFWKKKRVAACLASVSLLWLLAVSTPFLPDLLVAHLEQRYPVWSPAALRGSDGPTQVLLLGGGHTDDRRLPPNDQLSPVALARLSEGIRLQRLIPGSTLITSGYAGNSGVAQAELLAQTALLLGVAPAQIRMQTNPTNTRGEATEYRRLFGDKAHLIIVTSAVHMPRAMYLFRKAGLNPVAAPTNHLVKQGTHRDPWYWLPSAGNIQKTESAIHEYVGMIEARIGF